MECSARMAEINNDTFTEAKERAQIATEHLKWKLIYNILIQGCEVRENGRVYRLVDRMANEIEEFEAMVESDIDFMAIFLRGEFCEGVNNLFKAEARTLASIIVG